MALRWLEGFETHINVSQMTRKYASYTAGFNVAAGRVFGTAGQLAGAVAVTPSFGLADVVGVGFGVRINAQVTGLNSGAQGFYLERGPTEQVHLEFVNNAGSFEVKLMRGATQLAISSAAYAYGAWHHFELKVTVHPSTGTYELRHNEALVFSATGQNTANSGMSQADVFAMRFTTTSTNVLFDDIFVWDGTSASNNNFRGDAVIEGILPNGVGNSTQWTPSAGSNFDNVDDIGTAAPDDAGAGGFNESDTVGQKDLYAFQDLINIQGNIFGVQVGTQLAMAAAGSRTVKLRFRDDGGTEADGDTFTVSSTTYDEFVDLMDVNPQSGVAWDVADINGGQFGVEVVT